MSHPWKPRPSRWPAPPVVPPHTAQRAPALYTGLRWILPSLLRRLFDFHVSGREHLPGRGPFIVAANHANYLDGVILGAALPMRIVFLVMPRVYRATPLHPYFHDHVGSIPVSLARPDPGAMRRALRVLEDGGVLGIFPEGPCSRNGELVRGQPGVALLALRSGVPVVPAAITGTFQALDRRRAYVPRRVPVRLRFGPPLRFTAGSRYPQTQRVRADVTGRIMDEIAGLLADERELVESMGVPR
jgi:1-acyl-sn-glycerol-3-phosphate acyltransferase